MVVIQVFWYMTPCRLVKLPTFRVTFMPLDREYVQSAPNLRTIYPEDAGSKLRRNRYISVDTESYARPAREGLVVDKVAPGEVFLLVLRFSPVSTIAPVLYTRSSFIDTIHATGPENLFL
jgi:hypothetical protein